MTLRRFLWLSFLGVGAAVFAYAIAAYAATQKFFSPSGSRVASSDAHCESTKQADATSNPNPTKFIGCGGFS